MASPSSERKNNMKKLFLASLLLFAVSMAIPASAEETAASDVTTTAVARTEPATAPMTAVPMTVPITAPATVPVSAAPITTPVSDVLSDTEETLMTEISGILKEWVPEILSAAALIVSLVITYLFKKGLLPGVGKVLNGIKVTVSGYNERIEKFINDASAEREELKALSDALLAKLQIREEEVHTALSTASRILLAQSDSLFDLLEHTNLPAAEKAKIAAKHKEQLNEITAMMAGEGHGEA